jgi:hypothetical protein
MARNHALGERSQFQRLPGNDSLAPGPCGGEPDLVVRAAVGNLRDQLKLFAGIGGNQTCDRNLPSALYMDVKLAEVPLSPILSFRMLGQTMAWPF